jgi:hypothetical protein
MDINASCPPTQKVPCYLLVLVVYYCSLRCTQCDHRHHERSQTCIPKQQQYAAAVKCKSPGCTIRSSPLWQSRKEGKQKGTSVSSMKQSSRSKHQAMAFPIAGRLASQELAHARHGTARDSLERSRLWTGANKRCTIIKAKKRGEESTASAPLASCNSMDIWSVQPSSLSEARPKGASTPVSDEAQPSCIQTGSC